MANFYRLYNFTKMIFEEFDKKGLSFEKFEEHSEKNNTDYLWYLIRKKTTELTQVECISVMKYQYEIRISVSTVVTNSKELNFTFYEESQLNAATLVDDLIEYYRD